MHFVNNDRVFDTLIDTQINRVSMIKTKFTLRKDVVVNNQHPLYLHITGSGHKRERIHLDVYIENKQWDSTKENVNLKFPELNDTHLVIDNFKRKITDVKTTFKLAQMTLTPAILKEEFENKLSRINFIAFYIEALKGEKHNLKKGTYRKHHSVYLKLKEYNDYVPFNTLTIKWIDDFKKYCKVDKKNQDTTINTNVASIKKFLKIAEKNGIRLLFDLEDIEVGNTKGNRVALSKDEMKKIIKFYFSEFINCNDRLILGYFIHACLTGMRIGEVQALKRSQLEDDFVSFIGNKGDKDKNISLIDLAKHIIKHEPDLFVKKFHDNTLNSGLKLIFLTLGITKKISFHVSRHTFATNYLRAGGQVEKLQTLLGHSKIETTMIYVHITNAEANEDIFRLDNYYS